MQATAAGTARYQSRFPRLSENAFFRDAQGLRVSSLGIGTYLGPADDATDAAYTDALLAAAHNGINFFDTAINYRQQRSERAMGAALRQLVRDEIAVCTKAGFLTPGAIPGSLRREDVAGGMHSMAPDFLTSQIERSIENLGAGAIDVFYLHNPETQLGFLTPAEFDARIARAFERLEQLAADGKIRWYGAATWDGYRKHGALSLPRMAAIAAQTAGPQHRFRFVQLPFNLAMVEAYVDRPENVLECAARLGITVVASASLLQGRVLSQMPDTVAALLPGLDTPAQRALQFTRSTPGITVALAGMSRREHVLENLGVAHVAPASAAEYRRIFQ
ncbi:MAG: aldo/keto reductase [Acidobacteriota bacterium]|nr:aldo/keto reductase [Acidobacteriota bacterium]